MNFLKVIGLALLAGLLTVLAYWAGIVIAVIGAIISVIVGIGLVFLLIYAVLRANPDAPNE